MTEPIATPADVEDLHLGKSESSEDAPYNQEADAGAEDALVGELAYGGPAMTVVNISGPVTLNFHG